MTLLLQSTMKQQKQDLSWIRGAAPHLRTIGLVFRGVSKNLNNKVSLSACVSFFGLAGKKLEVFHIVNYTPPLFTKLWNLIY